MLVIAYFSLSMNIFSPFTFEVLINIVMFKATILLIVFYLSHLYFGVFYPLFLISFGLIA